MGNDRDSRILGQMPEHGAKDGQGGVRTARGAGLEDHGNALGLGGGDVGAHVLPSEGHEARDSVALAQRRLQHRFQRDQCHLNFATISMIPGIVCSCAAWVGWKYCFKLRWLNPPRIVK